MYRRVVEGHRHRLYSCHTGPVTSCPYESSSRHGSGASIWSHARRSRYLLDILRGPAALQSERERKEEGDVQQIIP